MTIDNATSCVDAVIHAVTGGRFRIQLTEDNGPGRRWGRVLDDAGNVIGSAGDYIYGGAGFAVQTRPYGGYVPVSQIDFVKGGDHARP